MSRTHRFAAFVLAACVATSAAGVVRAETPDEIYAFATHLQKDSLFDAAAAQFLKFARENPRDGRAPDALLAAADCLVKTKDDARAVTVLESIVDTYPDHPSRCRVEVELGRLYSKLERYQDADRVFTDVIVTMPNCPQVPDALLGKGEALIATGNYQGANQVLSSVVDKYVESKAAPRAAYNRAYCLKKMGRDDDALSAYASVVTQFPGDPIAGFAALDAARMYAKRGDDARAIQFYSRAKDLNTATFVVPAVTEGADLLQSMGRHKMALQWLEELLSRTDIADPRAIYVRAVRAAFNAEDYTSVRRLADEYDSRYAKTFAPQVAYLAARAAVKTGDYQRALHEADRLEAFAAGTEWGRAGARVRGEAYLGMGRASDAIDELERFVTIAADSTARCEVLRTIAKVSFTATRDTTRALDALTELLSVERHQYPGEILAVARTHERAGRYKAARALYTGLIERFPLSDEAETAEARVRFLDEFTVTDYEQAARSLDHILHDVATSASGGDPLLRLARARINVLKDFEGALAVCREMDKSARKTDRYPEVLYLAGLAHSKMARRAALSREGDQVPDAARDEMKRALDVWHTLEKDYAQSPWAAKAAFGGVILRMDVEGKGDVADAQAVIKRYPNQPDAVRLYERLGDYYAARSGKDDAARAADAYARALQIDSSSPRLWLHSAMARAAMGKTDDALKTFERLAGGDTRVGLRASYEAGRALRRLGHYQDAVGYFDRVAQGDPHGAFGSNAALQAADCVYMTKDYEHALARYQSAERSAPSEQRRWELSYREAVTLSKLGRNDEAMKRFDAVLASDQGGTLRARAYRDAADVAASMGDEAKEATLLEGCLAAKPAAKDATAVSKTLVRLYLRSGKADRARQLAERVASAGKDDVEAKGLLAMAMYGQGKSSDAKKLADQVAKAAGADAPIVHEIGLEAARYQYQQKAFKEAAASIRAYAEACSGGGECEDARYLYAMSLLAANQLQNGTTVAQAFFRDYPVSSHGPLLHLRLGNALAAANRSGESILHYEEAATTAKDSTVAFMALKNLGVTYQKLERWPDAAKVWSRVLSRFSSSQYAGEASLNLARCKMEQGDYKGAIQAYGNAVPMLDSESKGRAYYWMGESYEQLGDYQSAVVQYLKVPYFASESGGMWVVTAQLKAAECYTKIDRPDAAREIYTKVLRNHGADSNWGKVAQREMEKLDKKPGSNGGQ